MGKVTPIPERFQYMVRDLKESFLGDMNGKAPARTECARAQVWTLRERLLKLGARVLRSVRRVVVHRPASFPFLASFRRIALALDASPG